MTFDDDAPEFDDSLEAHEKILRDLQAMKVRSDQDGERIRALLRIAEARQSRPDDLEK
jgi:hypothetical protein